MTGCLVIPVVVIAHEGNNTKGSESLSGERVISGTVEEVRGEQAKVNTGEGQPRYLPMNLREEKGLPPLKNGDRVEIAVNNQNLIVDVHLAGEQSHHRTVHGVLAQPLVTGHEKAVIQSQEGQQESHKISSMARSKVASIPVGAEATFLIDEIDQIVDVTFENHTPEDKAQHLGGKKSPLKGNFKKVSGILKQPLKDNMIAVQPDGEKEHQYEVRPLIQEKFKKVSSGQEVVLFVDNENKVTDVAFVEKD
ncbi:MAG: hypothetical protein WBO24_20615 [Nitrospirales bacterium]